MTESRRVLVVDDSRTQAKQLALVLQAAKFAVEVATNGIQALEALRRHTFDLVLTDVIMPELGGYELCQCIKQDPDLKEVPVILLTTLNDADDIMRGLSSGADNFITKPYDPQNLIERVRIVLSNHGAARGRAITDPGSSDNDEATDVEFRFLGKDYGVRASRQQILTFLISTFEDYAGAKLREREALRRDMEHKRAAAMLLEKKNAELLEMNQRLEDANASLAQLNAELAAATKRLENSYDDLKREQALMEIEARRMEMELETARTVQRMLIPEQPPQDIPDFEFEFFYRPAAEIGGDWLNFYHNEQERKLHIFIGDVTNHGVASALVTAGVFSFFSTLRHLRGQEPALSIDAQLETLNDVILDMARQKLFMTFLASELDYERRLLHVANAGHPSPFIIRAAELDERDHKDRWRGIYSISLPGNQLGDIGDKHFPIRSIQLQRGDLVVWFTDGVSIGVNDHVGERRFIFWTRDVYQQPLADIRKHLETHLDKCLNGERPSDDIAFILARVR